MKRKDSRRRMWVGRDRSSTYLSIVAVTFGISVLGTRAYLALSGYPQIGGTTFHIAHAIWGGLALFIAGVLVLLYSNRSVLTVAAVLTGIGSGLFIDEIGKFITKKNDYFFPLAATLIYLFGMGLVGLVLWLQRRRSTDTATAALRSLEISSALTAGTIRPEELARLAQYSRQLASSDDPAHVALGRYAEELVVGTATEEDLARRVRRSGGSRAIDWLEEWDEKHIGRRPYRVLIILLTLPGVFSLFGTLILVPFVLTNSTEILGGVDFTIFQDGALDTDRERVIYAIQLGIQTIVHLLFAVSLLHWLKHRDAKAVRLGLLASVLQLAVVNTIAGYFDMEKLVFRLFLDIPLLLLLLRYKARFVDREKEDDQEPAPAQLADA